MQNRLLKNVLLLLVCAFLSLKTSVGQASSHRLSAADSLFQQKRYTQALQIYSDIFQQHQYSPSMLLKMAYIEEGLNHIGQAAYYLSLYYTATRDKSAMIKFNEFAVKNKLEGYAFTDADRILFIYQQYYDQVSLVLPSLCIMILFIMLFRKSKKTKLVGSAITMLFILSLLAVHLNGSIGKSSAIISQPDSYLMSGPSGASSVIDIIHEGHRVKIIGEKDIWVKVSWKGKEVYVKKNSLLPIEL